MRTHPTIVAIEYHELNDTAQPVQTEIQQTGSMKATLLTTLSMLIVLLGTYPAQSQQIDLLIQGGHVIDPKNGINQPMDIAIADGKVLQVAERIPARDAARVADARGMYVTPGLIDLHTHLFYGTDEIGYSGFEITNSHGSVQPDAFSFRTGVTTIVDAGSAGWRNFPAFRKQTIDNANTRVLAFISIAGYGMKGSIHANVVEDMDPEATAFMIQENRDVIVGVKKHHYRGGDFRPVERAVEAASIAGVPVMVDFGGHVPPLSLETLLMEKLRPGDMLTHTFFSSNQRQGSIDDEGNLRPFILQAQERGVNFDVGHGAGGFQWAQAVPATRQGFWPNTISTDLYRWSMNAGMKDMNNVMSKFLLLGMSFEDVIARSTWETAKVIQREDLGHLSVGAEADIAVLNLLEGEFGFLDARGQRINGDRKIQTELTVRAGAVVYDLNGISAQPFEGW